MKKHFLISTVQPFASKEFVQQDGLFYGASLCSKNIILIDRKINNNQNAIALGNPGGGRSFYM